MRKIKTKPRDEKNYFLVDACFLVEKYIPIGSTRSDEERTSLRQSKTWWKEIDRQSKAGLARVYVPDLCIAEAFKVLAKKYYSKESFKHSAEYKHARERLSGDMSLSHKVLKSPRRDIRYHDVPATRDIIIAVDRFYELFMKHQHNVGVIDLILVATAKYLMDFHDAKRDQIHLITMDKALWKGTKKIPELPNAYDLRQPNDAFDRVFER